MEAIYRKDKQGNMIRGIGLPAFIHNGTYFQVLIKVYEDGVIDCWDRVDLEGFKQKVKEGWVVTQVPQGADINCHHLYYGKSTLNCYVKSEEFVKEVEDTLQKLQGKRTHAQICQECFRIYLDDPTDANQEALRKAYEAVPQHLRCYLVDQDVKDGPIRAIVEGQEIDAEIFEYWREWYGKKRRQKPLKTYHSEEEEIRERFGCYELWTVREMANMMSDAWSPTLPQARFPEPFYHEQNTLTNYVQKMAEWLRHHSLTHEMTVRYMLVGLHTQLSGMRTFKDMSFAEVVEEYCRDQDIQRKFELFEKYYGKCLESFEEYENLFTLKNFDELTGEDLISFVVEGQQIAQ